MSTQHGNGYDIAAFVWPSYTGDEPRTRMFWPEGDGEWESVRHARPKYAGHQWPRRPLWGYCNEADSRVMEMQIDAAADHGVNVFIYDWYWYDGRPFLEQCLNNGYLRARNNHRVKFYVMWANHDVNHLWDRRIAHIDGNVIWRAALDRREFEIIGRRWIERYFSHPSYYTIDGKPVLMIFAYRNFINGLGGVDGATEAVAWLDAAVKKAGFPGLHLQLQGHAADDAELRKIGFESFTHYNFRCYRSPGRSDTEVLVDPAPEWERVSRTSKLPYFPQVSLGWDNNPRFSTLKSDVATATPEQVQAALAQAKTYADKHPAQPPLITLNSWNEWTEGSYLQPDDLNGYGYLEAVKAVFGGARQGEDPS
jgi:hypothetical protein